jgi:signal transduction histidine kinase
MRPGHVLRPVGRRLLADLAEQAGLAFRNARLAAQLSGEVDRLARRTDARADSRRRLISAGDAERSRLERAIDRQVAPHLTPLPDRLDRLTSGDADPTERADLLTGLQVSVDSALVALREITRGVFPAQLARSGLPVALASLVARAGEGGRLVVEESAAGRRFAPGAEAAAYFCAAETTRDLDDPTVVVSVHGDRLCLVVTGSDRGAIDHDDIRDRVEAARGTLVITSIDGRTLVDVQLPAHTAASRSGPNAALVM